PEHHQHDTEVDDVAAVTPSRRGRERDQGVDESGEKSGIEEGDGYVLVRAGAPPRGEELRELLHDDGRVEDAKAEGEDGGVGVEHPQRLSERARIDRLRI